MLGEPDPGYAGGAVHGWRGDLWGCGISTLPGTLTNTHPLNVLYTPYQGYYSFENVISLYFYFVFYLSLVLVSLTRD